MISNAWHVHTYLSHQTTICLGMTISLNPYRGPEYMLSPMAVAVVLGLLGHPCDRSSFVGYDSVTAL